MGKDNLIFLPKEEVRIVNKCVLCINDYTLLGPGPGPSQLGASHKVDYKSGKCY